jgi:hypothetical protein
MGESEDLVHFLQMVAERLDKAPLIQ